VHFLRAKDLVQTSSRKRTSERLHVAIVKSRSALGGHRCNNCSMGHTNSRRQRSGPNGQREAERFVRGHRSSNDRSVGFRNHMQRKLNAAFVYE
jgi:hypothetical protein